jgi:carbon storage regulator
MLVLTRNAGQTIVIDERIVITFVHIGKHGVKVGVDAPRELSIRRGELEPRPTGPAHFAINVYKDTPKPEAV